MRHTNICSSLFATLLALPASAASLASDNAANYTTTTWINGSNLGSGFGAWTLGSALGNQITNSNGNGGSPNINSANSTAFRIARGTSSFQQAERSFTVGGVSATTTLDAGQSFKFSLDPEVPNTNGQAVGLWLTDAGSGERWGVEIGRTSGGVNQFRIKNNGSTAIITTIPVADVDDGMNVTFNLLAAGAWTAKIDMLATNISYNLASTDVGYSALSTSPTGFRFFYASSPTNQSQYFNNFAVVPEPSSIALLGLAAVGGFLRRRRA